MSLLKFLRKCSESVRFDANKDFQEDLKNFKSDTFENYKSFVPEEVQNLHDETFLLLTNYCPLPTKLPNYFSQKAKINVHTHLVHPSILLY